jgi:hypothetical protein
VKEAVNSAVDVMNTMTSSICNLLSKVCIFLPIFLQSFDTFSDFPSLESSLIISYQWKKILNPKSENVSK